MVDGAFALLRARPRQLMTIAVVFVIPPQLGVALLQRQALSGISLRDLISDPTTADTSSNNSTWLVLAAFLLSSLSLPFVAAAVARVVVADRTGIEVSTKEAIALAGRRWWALLASWTMVHLAYVPGLFCFFIPIVLLMGVFIVVAPAVVMEQLGPWHALKRSWTLCKRRYGACLGVGILSGGTIYLLELSLSAVPSLLAVFTLGRWGWLLDAAAGTATALVTTPLIATCTVLLYIDLRVRTEGLDMELDRRRVFGV